MNWLNIGWARIYETLGCEWLMVYCSKTCRKVLIDNEKLEGECGFVIIYNDDAVKGLSI